MLSKIAKAMLIITSLTPVLITYLFVLILEKGPLIKILILALLILILIFLCIGILKMSRKYLEVMRFPIKSIKTADAEITSFFIAYIFPFITIPYDNINESVLIYFLCLLFVLMWGTHSYHTNPILTFFGYHFYEVTTPQNVSFLFITKRDLRNTKNISTVVQITDYMILDTEKGR